MHPNRKAAAVVWISAAIASAPFTFLLFWHLLDSTSVRMPLLMPLALGVLAYTYCALLIDLFPSMWQRLSPLTGALAGLLTFVSFCVVATLLNPFTAIPPLYREVFQVVDFALLFFGWVPLLIGGGAAWLGRSLFERQG